MKQSLITTVGVYIKKATGINDISLVRKNLKKQIGKLIYHKKYTTEDLIQCMKEMGIGKGSTVCIHSSMKEFYNYKGTANELIDAIIGLITEEGTLIMPAFPPYNLQKDKEYIFNPRTDKSGAGYLAETFRKRPDVVRSINVQHSVVAWGKHAEWLTKDHHKCTICWDEDSPWYRMTQLDAIVLNLGMPLNYIGTFDHCVETLLYKEHPYWAQFFNEEKTYRYYDNDGEVRSYECKVCTIERRTHEQNLIKYFPADAYKKTRLSNLLITSFKSKDCLDKMVELGRKGITMYYVPSPKNYKF